MIWWFFTKDLDQQQRDEFYITLMTPPPGDSESSPEVTEELRELEMSAFNALARQTGGG